MKREDKLELVWHAAGNANAEMIKMYLESFDIPVYIFGESVGSAYGLMNTPLGEVAIYVPAEQAIEAKQKMAIYNEGRINQDDSEE